MRKTLSALFVGTLTALSACSSSSADTSAGATGGSSTNSTGGSASGPGGGSTGSAGNSGGTSAGISASGSGGSATGNASSSSASSSSGTTTGAASNLVVWVPDYYGQALRVLIGSSTSPVSLELPATCTPNSVVVNGGQLYVACNAGTGASGDTIDQLLIYDSAATASILTTPAGSELGLAPTKTVTDDNFDSLIGMAFDSQGDLWLASYGNDEVLEITAASLASDTPASTVNLIDSPSSPVALAFDTDGSLWVTGQYLGGILLNFTADQQNQGASATPRYCMVETGTNQDGCQYAPFLGTEGLALFNGDIWVANNDSGADGQTPGREIFDIRLVGGALTLVATYGDSATPGASPIVCPGGLFATAQHLWVNDESYGEANPKCGAGGDVAPSTGGIFDLSTAQLGALASQAPAYTNVTGRPGFGGIFIQNDD